MTVQELALRGALTYSGIPSMDPADNVQSDGMRGKSASIIADCVSEINASIQFIADRAPQLFKKPGGGILKASTSGTLTATLGSTTISAFSAYAADMRGCTIRITGDDFDNEIISATEIARPFLGSSGSGLSATIYYDCIPLSDTIRNVVDPVMIPGLGQVFMADSREQFLTGMPLNGPRQEGVNYTSLFPFSANYTKMIGRPVRWMAEETYNASATTTLLLLRFYPMPNQQFGVAFQTVLKPPTYTVLDVDNGGNGSDPGTTIPFPWVESTLLPILKQRWTSHYSFGADGARQEIQRQAFEVMQTLEDGKPARGYKTAIYS